MAEGRVEAEGGGVLRTAEVGRQGELRSLAPPPPGREWFALLGGAAALGGRDIPLHCGMGVRRPLLSGRSFPLPLAGMRGGRGVCEAPPPSAGWAGRGF